jgi:Nuclease-related domain
MKGSVLDTTLISGAIALGAIGIVLLALRFVRIHLKIRKCPPSPNGNSLCDPGESQLAQIDDLDADIWICSLELIVLPILIFTAHISYSYFGRQPESWERIAISFPVALVFMGYFLRQLASLTDQRRFVRLAYEGKVAAGQAMNQLQENGYRIFHEFPGDDFKIDHLAIGPTGIMAMKTKTQALARSHGRDGEAVVRYDGRMLHFPKFSDFETLDEVKAQAEWLSQWLSTEVGEDICARAMVVLPGWSVKRTSADGIPVVNPNQFENLFKFIKPRPMSEDLMQRITQLIEGRCRDRAN